MATNNKVFKYYYDKAVKLRTDPLDSSHKNAVLGWFDEEQGVLMEVAEKYIPYALKYSTGNICIDPGCGAASLSLAAVKKFEPSFRKKINTIVAIDVNKRAVSYAKENAKKNNVYDLYNFKIGKYDKTSIAKNSAAIISHNVPYHPTNRKYAGCPFISCEGGEDGQKILRQFLEYSAEHLAKNGILYGIINCRGDKHPEFMNYIRKWYKNDSIYWYRIHKPCSTFGFLEYITRWKESDWARSVAKKYPLNHVGIYVVVRDGKKKEKSISLKLRYKTTNWQFRWDAHRLIQDRAYDQKLNTSPQPHR